MNYVYDYWDLYLVFREIRIGQKSCPHNWTHKTALEYFYEYIGEEPKYHGKENPPFYELSDEANRRMQSLLTPLGITLAKIWLIKKLQDNGT